MGILVASNIDRYANCASPRANLPHSIGMWCQRTFEGHAANRIASLEGSRGLAMVFVFLIHLHEFLLPFAHAGSITVQLAGFLYTVGNLAGDFFLVITGCLIYRSLLQRRVPYWSFVRQRMTRVYPVFFDGAGRVSDVPHIVQTAPRTRAGRALRS